VFFKTNSKTLDYQPTAHKWSPEIDMSLIDLGVPILTHV